MVDLVTAAAVALLVLGVVGSVVPLVPGPVLSLAGIWGYWWVTGRPGPLLLAALTLVGVVAVVVDYLAGAVSAKAGGASLLSSVAAGVVGLVALVFTGPLGLVVGVVGTVFIVEFVRSDDAERSARTAARTALGLLASAVVQLLLTATMLVAFLVVVL